MAQPAPTFSIGAVFLSYASQDAAAARQIYEALGGAGVEVWFDQSELRGGDAWDAKIRRQIRECALFMPLISANSDARSEGYFRLEWKLAVDRSHLMAEDAPFILPVVIDGTGEAQARVPDRFRDVQWMRVRGDPTPDFVSQVKGLLGPQPLKEPTTKGAESPGPGTKSPSGRPSRSRIGFAVALAAMIAIALMVYLRRSRPNPPASLAAGAPTTATRDWPKDPDLKRALTMLDQMQSSPESYHLAEEIVKGVLARNTFDPEAVTSMARVQVWFLVRGFDSSPERRQQAKHYTDRALLLAPEEPEALAAAGVYRYMAYVSGPLAGSGVPYLKKAMARDSSNPMYGRYLALEMARVPGANPADVIAAGKRNALNFPTNILAQYDYARLLVYMDAPIAESEAAFDQTLKVAPIPNAIAYKAWISLWARGDLVEMKSWIDRMPPESRSLERGVFMGFVHAFFSQQPQESIDSVQEFTGHWLEDFDYHGPKGLLLGSLLQMDGKNDLAKLQLADALAEIQRRRTQDPSEIYYTEPWILAALGRKDEAWASWRLIADSLSHPYIVRLSSDWVFQPIPFALLLGDRKEALRLIKEAASRDVGRQVIRSAMAVDPRMAAFRNDPEIVRLLAEPAGR